MAVVKRRRNQYSRKQQQLQDARQKFLNERWKPGNVSSLIHDESDAMSYRLYLLNNFQTAATNIQVLLTDNHTKIIPPDLKFNKQYMTQETLTRFENELKETEEKLQEKLQEKFEVDPFIKETTDYLNEVDLSSSSLTNNDYTEKLEEIIENYMKMNDYRYCDGWFHRFPADEFKSLKIDLSEAPAEYWQMYKNQKGFARDDVAETQMGLQFKPVEKGAETVSETSQASTVSQETGSQEQHPALQQDHQKNDDSGGQQQEQPQQQQDQQQGQQQQPDLTEEEKKEPLIGEQNDELDPVFTEFGSDTFNNEFSEDFGDLDTAFL